MIFFLCLSGYEENLDERKYLGKIESYYENGEQNDFNLQIVRIMDLIFAVEY